MFKTVVAFLMGFYLVACGNDSKESNPTPAPGPSKETCEEDPNKVCADDLFDDLFDDDPFDPSDPDNQDPFDPSDPVNQNPFPGDDDDDDDVFLRVTSIKSYLDLKKDAFDGFMHDGRCHVDVEVRGNDRLTVKVQKNKLKNKMVGFGKSTSCLVRLGVKFRRGYAFNISKIRADLNTDIKSNSEGKFFFDYYVRSSQSTLEYRKTVKGPEKKCHRLELVPNKNNWSSCSGKDVLGLTTFFETNYKKSDYTSSEWMQGLEKKKKNKIKHGYLSLDEGEYQIKLEWSKCG